MDDAGLDEALVPALLREQLPQQITMPGLGPSAMAHHPLH
jgi:hypothetical protein